MVEGTVTASPSAEPGPWMFVIGRAFLAAVPADADQAIVQSLAAFASHAVVDLESMVTLLPMSGDGALASFALVVPEPGSGGAAVSVLVRGSLAVDVYSVGGSRRFGAGGVLPWLLADFQAVTGIVIGDSAVPPAPLAPHAAPLREVAGTGVRLTWQLTAGTPDAAAPASEPTRAMHVPDHLSDAVADTAARTGTAVADTILLPSSPRRHSAASTTMTTDSREELPRYGFQLGGCAYRLDRSYYLGRQPRTPRIHTGPTPGLLSVPSPTRSVSATHLEIRQEGDAVVITDLGSTNGTVLFPPVGAGERLRQRTSRTVVPGTRVDIGDGNIVEILPVSGDDSSLPPAQNRKAQP